MRKPIVSVIVPCYNEINYIENFINSLSKFESDFFDLEYILVDGGSDDGTIDVINKLTKQFNIKLLINKKNIVPMSLNLAINNSIGDYIARLDVHSKYPKDYLKKLYLNFVKYPNCGNIGYRIKTISPIDNQTSKCISYFMSHPFGVGNSMFRIDCKGVLNVDTVPFGFFNKTDLIELGGFDEDMYKNEDDELNLRLIKKGKTILLLCSECLEYFSRPDLPKATRMMFQYGFFKPFLYKKNGKLSSYRQLVPPLFVLSILSTLSLIPISIFWFLIFTVIYFSFLAFAWFNDMKKINLFIVIKVFFCLHFIYGLGYLFGFVDSIFNFGLKNLKLINGSTR